VREPVQQRAHDVIVARLTYVGGTLIQCLGPQLVVRQPVGADDAKGRELMMQALDFARAGSFQIQHQGPSPMPGNRGTDFFVTAGQMNGIKVSGKANRQSVRGSGIVLIKHYTEWFHTSP